MPRQPAGTLMVDTFTFESSLGILGRIADALVVTSYMRRLLEHRARELKRMTEIQRP